MKTIKPKYVPAPKVIKPIETTELIGGNNIENLMNSVLKEKEEILQQQPTKEDVKVEFYLTKKQFEKWEHKGGVKWLKKAIYKKG